jgi:hypothetical protein
VGDPPLSKRRECIAFVYYLSYVAIGPLLVTPTKTLGSVLLHAFTSSTERTPSEPTQQAVPILALLIPSIFAAYCFAFERLVALNAVGLPMVIAGFTQETKALFVERRSVDERALHWGYLCVDTIDNDAFLNLGASPLGSNLAPLPTLAVTVHKVGLILQLFLMVMALSKLLWLPGVVQSYFLSNGLVRPGRKDDVVVENVFRLTRRFDLEQFADEYYTDISMPTVRTSKQVFQLLSRSGPSGDSDVTVWLSANLCLCNYDALDPAAANRSSSTFLLESICFFVLPGIDHVLGVYVLLQQQRQKRQCR